MNSLSKANIWLYLLSEEEKVVFSGIKGIRAGDGRWAMGNGKEQTMYSGFISPIASSQ